MRPRCTRFHHLAAAAIIAAGLASAPAPAQSAGSPTPGLADFARLRFQIVDALFVTQYDGVTSRYDEKEPAKFRGLLLTVRVEKPAGEELQLEGRDFSLHYTRDDSYDVASVDGLSAFSTSKDTDRPMRLSYTARLTAKTGVAATKAAVVYVDMFFLQMEPDTRDLHLLAARPIGTQYRTNGWK
jgi:hypothetical protein